MPVTKCSNGKWRIGNGSCIYDTKEKAVEVWVAILASGGGEYAKEKISYDYDGVLSKSKWVDDAIKKVNEGADVYVISARDFKEDIVGLAAKIGIPTSHIFATGSNKNKVQKIKDLGISVHYDNNPDVINVIKDFTKGIIVK